MKPRFKGESVKMYAGSSENLKCCCPDVTQDLSVSLHQAEVKGQRDKRHRVGPV